MSVLASISVQTSESTYGFLMDRDLGPGGEHDIDPNV